MQAPYIVFFPDSGGTVYQFNREGDNEQVILRRPMAIEGYEVVEQSTRNGTEPPEAERPGIVYRSKADAGYIPLSEIEGIVAYTEAHQTSVLDGKQLTSETLIDGETLSEESTV